MADQVDDVGLDDRFGEHGIDRSGKPFSPSTTAIRMSATPQFFNSFMTRS
jgi:hypothetical protein